MIISMCSFYNQKSNGKCYDRPSNIHLGYPGEVFEKIRLFISLISYDSFRIKESRSNEKEGYTYVTDNIYNPSTGLSKVAAIGVHEHNQKCTNEFEKVNAVIFLGYFHIFGEFNLQMQSNSNLLILN